MPFSAPSALKGNAYANVGDVPWESLGAGDTVLIYHRDARNNIAYVTAGGANLVVLDNTGRLTLTQNWFKTGWTPFQVNRPKGTITDNGTLTGSAPGFVSEAGQDYHLASGSPAIDSGASLHIAVLPTHDVVREYVKHQASVARAVHGSLDIGAFEF